MKPRDLKSWLWANKMSVYEFSYRAKLTPPTIYTFLAGVTVRPKTIQKIKMACGL